MGWALFFGGDCILKRWVTVLRTRKYKIRSNDKKNNISHVISSVECFSCSKFLTLYSCVKIGHLRIIPTNGDKTWSSLASASTTLTVVGVYKVVEPLHPVPRGCYFRLLRKIKLIVFFVFGFAEELSTAP